ncbi:MAG: type II secretion system F family protein [Erysipelotrichaceae bacterium]|nr:type II secretion system F family protein [Erysipelotrichaceae bacterium]
MSRKKELDYLGVSAFAESMAMMIQSGLSIEEALTIMKQGKSHGILAEAMDGMAREAEEGHSLHEIMSNAGIFPEYALEMVRTGERTGSLERVMRQLADYYQNEKETSDRLRSVVIYPASMIAMIIAVLIIMLILVLPVFSDVYQSLSISSLRYVNIAYGLCWGLLILMAVIVIIAVVGLILWNTGHRQTVEKVLRHFPALRRIIDDMGTFRFTSAYAINLSSGELQDAALADSLKLTNCASVEEKLQRCQKHMEEGHNFVYAVNKEEVYEPIYGRMLIPAERSGSTENVLNRLTGLLKEDISAQVGYVINTVEPLLSGILMIVIGLVLVSVMLPLVGMMTSII